MRHVLRVAGYRWRATFAQRWRGYLTLVILIGSIGGIAMGAVAAGRRTHAAFPAFVASTNPSDLNAQYSGSANSYDPVVVDAIARLPHVTHVESFAVLSAAVLNPDGTNATDPTRIPIAGSVDGALFDQDRFTVTQGRMANPERADEVVVSQLVADTLGLHVGQTLPIGIITADAPSPGPGQPFDLHERVDATIVGIGKLNSEVVEDDVGRFPTYIVATPALTRPLLDCCVSWMWFGLQLDHGNADVTTVEHEYIAALAQNTSLQFRVTGQVEAQAQRAIEPEAIALVAFGAIAAAAGLLVAGQAIGRQLRTGREDLDILRALGAGPGMTTSDGLVGVVGAIVIGALVAAGVAIALSPLGPIGPVRDVDPSPGIAVDWTVLGGGLVVFDRRPRRARGGSRISQRTTSGRSSRSATYRADFGDRARRRGLGAAGTGSGGIRFALEAGRGRTAVPVRSAMAGTALAVVLVVATLTFGNSLASLVSRPALYGWDWSYALESTDGYGPIPPQGQTMLDNDPDVAASAGVYFATVDIDGQAVPAIFGSTHAALAPPILSGHTLDRHARSDRARRGHLGAAAQAGRRHRRSQLRKSDRPVLERRAAAPPCRRNRHHARGRNPRRSPLVDGHGSADVLRADSGRRPESLRSPFGAEHDLRTLRDGADPTAAAQSLQQIADSVNEVLTADPTAAAFGAGVYLLPVQRPAEIVNYRSMGNTPPILAAGLAAGAVVALGLTLAASVRRRRRDLALLKTLGFTHRQLAAVVAWQASVAAVVGIVVGVPVGIVLGRWLWILFAHQIFAVPRPTVPATVGAPRRHRRTRPRQRRRGSPWAQRRPHANRRAPTRRARLDRWLEAPRAMATSPALSACALGCSQRVVSSSL